MEDELTAFPEFNAATIRSHSEPARAWTEARPQMERPAAPSREFAGDVEPVSGPINSPLSGNRPRAYEHRTIVGGFGSMGGGGLGGTVFMGVNGAPYRVPALVANEMFDPEQYSQSTAAGLGNSGRIRDPNRIVPGDVDPANPESARRNTSIARVRYVGKPKWLLPIVVGCSECVYMYTETKREAGPYSMIGTKQYVGKYEDQPTDDDIAKVRGEIESALETDEDLSNAILMTHLYLNSKDPQLQNVPQPTDVKAMIKAISGLGRRVICPPNCPNKIVDQAGYRFLGTTYRLANQEIDGIPYINITSRKNGLYYLIEYTVWMVAEIRWRVGAVVCCLEPWEEPEESF